MDQCVEMERSYQYMYICIYVDGRRWWTSIISLNISLCRNIAISIIIIIIIISITSIKTDIH